MDNYKIGLITNRAPENVPDKPMPQESLDKICEDHEKVKKMLAGLGFEVVDAGGLKREYHDMLDAGLELRSKRINALVVYVHGWTFTNAVVAAALETCVPVLVLAEPGLDNVGLVGGAITRGAMAEYGIYSELVYSPFDREAGLKKIKSFLLSACAAYGLRGQIMGVAGGRCMGMVTTVVDPNEIRKKFGVDIDTFEQFMIVKRAEEIDDKKVGAFYEWMQKEYGAIEAEEKVVKKQIRLYFALEEYFKEHDYDFAAVKCHPEMLKNYTSFCLAHAVFGDDKDYRGSKDRFILACEADINAALTMQILHLLQPGPVLFSDLLQFDYDTSILKMGNCGAQPTDFACSKKDVTWKRDAEPSFDWADGSSASPHYIARKGTITLARLYRDNGSFEMFITAAEFVDRPDMDYPELLADIPNGYARISCEIDTFISALRSNHIHAVYGDFTNELAMVCEMLDIRPARV